MGIGRAACAPGEIGDTVLRVGWRQGAAVAFANLDGAAFVFVYTTFLIDDVADAPVAADRTTDLLLFLTYMVLAVAIGGTSCYRRYTRRTRWLEEGDEPTEDRRVGVLRLPLDTALFNLIPWMVAAVLFGAMSAIVYDRTAHHVARTSGTIVLGGLVTCALSFMLMERAMRPLFALALDGHVVGRHATVGVRTRFTLTWALGSLVPLGGIAVVASQNDGQDITSPVIALALAGIVAGLVATNTAAKSVADPLDEVRTALAKVEQGNLDVQVPVDDGGEVGRLQAGVNQMVEGLQERHRLADLFGRHVGTEVARRALVEGAGLDSEAREASALFVDVVGSTAMAEVLPPQEVVNTLNAFFGAVVAAVSAEGGWVNKFEGDGALCVFGAPAAQPDHAVRALRAARDLRDRIERLAGSHPGLDAAIGVSSGPVVAGNVGTEARYEYTIIGRPVNEAARLSELAKSRPGRALASSGALERAGDEAARWAGLGSVALRGQQAPTSIYEPAETVASSV
jgi:adenylate cyclase